MSASTVESIMGGLVDDILSEISSSDHLKNPPNHSKEPLKDSMIEKLGSMDKVQLYKSRQFYCRDARLSSLADSEDELIVCPLCLLLTKKSEYSRHVKRSEKHSSYLQIEDLYLTYCDRRRVNPVSCQVLELQSFIQRLAYKSEENILPVWIYLASRHEADLTSLDNVRDVLESPLRRRRSHQICPTDEDSMPTYFACYSCPYFCRTAQDLFRHVHGPEHAIATKSWSIRGGSTSSEVPSIFTNLYCDCCDEDFESEAALKLHPFGRQHLGGGTLKKVEETSPCILCDTEDDVDLECHISDPEHREKESMADGFLIFCYQNGLEIPLKISPDSLIRFLETLPVSSLTLNVRLLRRLFGSDRNPLCPFNHKKVKIFISYTELSGSVYSPDLPNKTIDILTRCSFENQSCSDTRFERTTKLLYHSVSNHRLTPSEVLKGLFVKIDNEESWCDKKPKDCKDCPNKLFTSPLLYALHKDTHEVSLECETCKVVYRSASQYYYDDKCGPNNVPQSIKDCVDQTIKTLLLTSEMGIPLQLGGQNIVSYHLSDAVPKKRKRPETSGEEGLVGNWLLNCPTVRARKISVASRKRVDGEDSEGSSISVHSSKIVLEGSPQILPEIEDEKEVNGNLRKRPKLTQTGRPIEKPLRRRLSDRILRPSLKPLDSDNRPEAKPPKNDKPQKNSHNVTSEPVPKKLISEKKTTPKSSVSKYSSSPKISPALVASGPLAPRQTLKSKLNSSRNLFKKDLIPTSSKIHSPNRLDSKGGCSKVPQPLKSRKSDIPMRMKSMVMNRRLSGNKELATRIDQNSPNTKLNETITKILDDSSLDSRPSLNRASTFVKDEEDICSEAISSFSSLPTMIEPEASLILLN